MDNKICILGCGSFGLALAHLLAPKYIVHIWEYNKQRSDFVIRTGKSDLISYKLHKNIHVSSDIVSTVQDASFILVAIPSQFVVSTVLAVRRHFSKDAVLVLGSKGLDTESKSFLFETLEKKISQKIFVLSGPMFAVEIVKDIPVSGVLAGKDKRKAETVLSLFADTPLTLLYSDDIMGTSLCGAVKNVYAIGSGILKGLGFENSTNALYLTRCVQEMGHLVVQLKGNKETLLSPAGIGDLILTATSNKSRNFTYGEVVGKGIAPKNIEFTVEGRQSLWIFFHLLKTRKIEAPIICTLYDIVYKNKPPCNITTLLK